MPALDSRTLSRTHAVLCRCDTLEEFVDVGAHLPNGAAPVWSQVHRVFGGPLAFVIHRGETIAEATAASCFQNYQMREALLRMILSAATSTSNRSVMLVSNRLPKHLVSELRA